MSDTTDRKETALITTGSTALTTRSSALVKRGLETLASARGRIVHFPSDRSMGTLYISSSPEEIDIDQGVEDRGNITLPTGKRICLLVADEAITALSALALLNPDDLQGLLIWSKEVKNEDFVHIKHLEFLEELDLMVSEQITDLALRHIGKLRALRRLSLYSSHISDDGLIFLKPLIKLEYLNLRRCNSITNNGLTHIVPLKNLRHLNLGYTQVNAAGLAYLYQLTRLTSLYLSHLEIYDADIAISIRRLTDLTSLWLDKTHITDKWLSYLGTLTNLQHLHLASCEITDPGLVHLQNLKALEWLNLSHTNVSHAAINSLQEALPKCHINMRETPE